MNRLISRLRLQCSAAERYGPHEFAPGARPWIRLERFNLQECLRRTPLITSRAVVGNHRCVRNFCPHGDNLVYGCTITS